MSEHPSTADDDRAIALWRCSLLARDEILREDIDELEAHVREAVAERVADGVTESRAVTDAIAEVGVPRVVAAEYAKADPGRVWRRRVQRMLAGPLVALAALVPITLTAVVVTVALRAAGIRDEWALVSYLAVTWVGVLAALVAVGFLARGRTASAIIACAAAYAFLAGLGYVALVSFRGQRYAGFREVIQVCGVVGYGPAPVAMSSLLLLTMRAEARPVRDGLRELTT